MFLPLSGNHNKYVYCFDPIVSIKIYIDDRYSAQIYIIDCIVRVVFLKEKEDPKVERISLSSLRAAS